MSDAGEKAKELVDKLLACRDEERRLRSELLNLVNNTLSELQRAADRALGAPKQPKASLTVRAPVETVNPEPHTDDSVQVRATPPRTQQAREAPTQVFSPKMRRAKDPAPSAGNGERSIAMGIDKPATPRFAEAVEGAGGVTVAPAPSGSAPSALNPRRDRSELKQKILDLFALTPSQQWQPPAVATRLKEPALDVAWVLATLANNGLITRVSRGIYEANRRPIQTIEQIKATLK